MDEVSLPKLRRLLIVSIVVVSLVLIYSFSSIIYAAVNQPPSIENEPAPGQTTLTDPTNTLPTTPNPNPVPAPNAGSSGGGSSSGGGGGGGGGGSGGSSGSTTTSSNPAPPPTCTPTNNGVEICDNLDNDCDGFIDEEGVCGQTLYFAYGTTSLIIEDISGDAYLKRLTTSAGTLDFEQVALWELVMRDLSGQKITLRPSDFPTRTIGFEEDTFVITWSGQSIIPGDFSIGVSVKVIDDTAGFYLGIDNLIQTHSLYAVDFPRLAVKPIGNPAKNILHRPFLSGILEFEPQNMQETFGESPSWKQSMQYLSLYNPEENKQFYLQTNDEEGYRKDFYYKGLGSSTLTYIKNYPENNIVPEADYGMPYNALISVIPGNWYDAASRYRSWALQQSWVSSGTIESRQDIPQSFKDAKLLVTLSTQDEQFNNFDLYFQEGNKIKNYLQTSNNEILFRWYNWHNNLFDRDLPDYLPLRSTVLQALVNAQVNGHYVIPYLNLGPWAYQSQSYQTNNIEEYAVREENGSPLIVSLGAQTQGHVVLDVSLPQSETLITGLLQSVLSEIHVPGIYLDLWSGSPALLDYSSNHGHPLGGGNYWMNGKKQITNSMASIIESNNAEGVILSESLEEYLIKDIDLMFAPHNFNGKTIIPAWETVYHEYITTSYGYTVPQMTPALTDSFKDLFSYNLHSGRLPEISNWFTDTGSLISEPPTSAETELFEYIKQTINNQYVKKYLRFGQRLDPLPISFEKLYEERILPEDHIPHLLNSIWKASDGDIGIIFTNTGTGTGGAAAVFPIDIPLTSYSSESYDVYENVNGNRNLILSDVSSDFVLNADVPVDSLKLYELVQISPVQPSPPQEIKLSSQLIIFIIVLIALLMILIILLKKINRNIAINKYRKASSRPFYQSS